MFGVITRENLAGGIVERRQNGTLVVYRTFRKRRDMLTPFGLFFSDDPLRVSESDYMVITEADFETLLAKCSGADASKVRIMAKPLLDKDRQGTTAVPFVYFASPLTPLNPPTATGPRKKAYYPCTCRSAARWYSRHHRHR